jgi:hypothetical protein
MSTRNDEERRELEELLPWFAAGTLARRDMQRVEDAIEGDPALARKYEAVLEELAGTAELNETLGAPSSRVMQKLFANIDAEPARHAVRTPSLAERLSEFLASLSPRTLAWSATIAGLLIVLQAGFLGGVLIDRGAFQVAGGNTASSQPAFALVRFAPDATAAEIAQLLDANDVSIAEGPLPGGLYRIRPAAGELPEEQATRIIEQLRADKAVNFIAPTE